MQRSIFILLSVLVLAGCNPRKTDKAGSEDTVQQVAGTAPMAADSLPAPYATKSVKNYSKVVGWAEGKTPQAPDGFEVIKFASGLRNPRWIYVAPNGDILVAEANTESKGTRKLADAVSGKANSQNLGESANRISLLRDKDNDGKPEVQQVLLSGLNQPLGMLVLGNILYVANTDGVVQFPYQPGQTQIKAEGKKILDLPVGGYNNHWTRNLVANAKGTKIYVAVGSGSNVAEHGMENEIRRANILEINPDGTGERIFASGLRNPVGLGWAPGTNTLWAAVNERDELGDDLVPDYLTSVQEGAFYGWPYSYFGNHEDPRLKGERPDLVQKAIVPDVELGPHTASLGLAFYDQKAFPQHYQGGAFVGQHGSWNRSELSGYKVVFVPFTKGKPGKPEDFLTGFIGNISENEVYGRPVGVAVLQNGTLLVADDASNTLWLVRAKAE